MNAPIIVSMDLCVSSCDVIWNQLGTFSAFPRILKT